MTEEWTPKATRFDSYIFWMDILNTHPEKLNNFKLGDNPKIYYKDWTGSDCKICHGMEYVQLKGTEHEVFCFCSTLRWMEHQWLQNSYFQTLHQPAKLEDLIPISVPDENAAKDLRRLKEYLTKWIIYPKEWIWIQGGFGCGKSHILKSINTALPIASIYISSEDFQSKLFAARDQTNGVQILQDGLSSVPILLFDDWGLEYSKSDWTTTSFANIINSRNQFPKQYITVVTSNLASTELKSSGDVKIRRIVDRLTDVNIATLWQLRQASFRSGQTQGKIK